MDGGCISKQMISEIQKVAAYMDRLYHDITALYKNVSYFYVHSTELVCLVSCFA
jgi:hypothetical protein